MSVWAIYRMVLDDDEANLYALTCDGAHVISRVTLSDATRYTRGNISPGDTVQYNGYEFTYTEWNKGAQL